MIPKKIHYCWFGQGEMPKREVEYIEIWKKMLPDYELILWNESKFDLEKIPFVKEAYEARKFAFVSDYVRLYALNQEGGIYLDTDIEIVKPLDKFLEADFFIGYEENQKLGTGVIGSVANHPFTEALLKEYSNKRFVLPNGEYDLTPNPEVVSKLITEMYQWDGDDRYQELADGIAIYPFEVLCAKNWDTKEVTITENTYAIHHFSASWVPKSVKIKKKIIKILGPGLTQFIIKIKKLIKR